MTGSQTLAAGRAKLCESHPYFASAVYSLNFIESDQVPTLGVDLYWRCYYNPEYLAGRTSVEIATMLAHEIGHLLRAHHDRTPKGANPVRYNLAGDMEINDDLRSDHALKVQPEWVFPESYKAPEALIMEEYLKYLPNDPGKGGKGSKGTGNGQCGSCATGQPEDYEDASPGAGGAEGISKAEQDLVRQKVAEDVASRGDCPAGLRRWANGLVKPQVPWQQVLKGAVRTAVRSSQGMHDYTYSRPNRRSVAAGVILPSMHKFIPEIAVVIDTSGSMSNNALAQAVGEVDGVLKAVGGEVYVLTVDAGIAGGVQRVRRAAGVNLLGGGGTDMRVGIEAALKTKSDVVVVITDCITPWPASAPSKSVVVVAVGYKDTKTVPSWARLVEVDTDGH